MTSSTKRSIICTILLIAMFVAICIPAMAASNKVISLPANKTWKLAGTETRSGDYSYVTARNHSVYPSSGTDLFGMIQFKITNSDGTLICNSDYYTLDETATASSIIYVREGYLNTEDVRFYFRGNTNLAATAVVSYNPM